jgi:hypothetical protein
MPDRIQRSRAKGWRMPEGAVYVGRGSRWGNPYKPGMSDPNRPGVIHVMVDEECCAKAFRHYASRKLEGDPHWLDELRGKDLVCWCPLAWADGRPRLCHADVLLELANAPLRCEAADG